MSKITKTELMIFKTDDLGIELKGTLYQGKPVFFAVKVAEALGYAQSAKALNDHCKSLIKLNCVETAELNLGFRPKGIILVPEGDVSV